ncbi:MAG TPA: hypothetical protein V6D18_19690 [Thermosynechococcaceae cyanobacterium]
MQADLEVAIHKDLDPEARQLQETGERFGSDVRWHTRQKKAREWLTNVLSYPLNMGLTINSLSKIAGQTRYPHSKTTAK